MTTKNQPQLDVPQLVLEAHERCQEQLPPTPLEYSRYLSEKIKGEVWLKLDSMQRRKLGVLPKIMTRSTCKRLISPLLKQGALRRSLII